MNIEITKLTVYEDYKRSGEPYRNQNKIYVWTEGETILENLVNRRSRPHTIYKKEVIPLIMKMLETSNPEVYNRLKDTAWGWRQKCGCSMCPCSPGFVSDRGGYWDIHASIKISE
jgi:hypothetical protein